MHILRVGTRISNPARMVAFPAALANFLLLPRPTSEEERWPLKGRGVFFLPMTSARFPLPAASAVTALRPAGYRLERLKSRSPLVVAGVLRTYEALTGGTQSKVPRRFLNEFETVIRNSNRTDKPLFVRCVSSCGRGRIAVPEQQPCSREYSDVISPEQDAGAFHGPLSPNR